MVDKTYIDAVSENSRLAMSLAWYQAWTGDWRNMDYREKIKAVTKDDILRVAKRYFTESNRTVVTLVPTKKEEKNMEE